MCISILHWQVSILSHTGDHHPYIHGIPSCTNEIIILQIFLLCVHCFKCYEVAICRCPLMFHENYSVSYYENFFSLAEYTDFYENLTLRKFGTVWYCYDNVPIYIVATRLLILDKNIM